MQTRRVVSASLFGSLLFLVACSGAPTSEEETTGSVASQEVAEPDISPGPTGHVFWQKGMAPARASRGSNNLIDHGGRVLATSHLYAIWWGNASAWSSDTTSGIDALLRGLNGTSFLGIVRQYMRGASVSSSFHGNYTDTSSPPSRAPSTSTIVKEACKVINAHGL